jgi:hypothetical protein
VKIERSLLPNKVVAKIKKMVDEFKNTLPVIQNLRNKSLKERHWKKIEAEMGQKVSCTKKTEKLIFNFPLHHWILHYIKVFKQSTLMNLMGQCR